MQECPEEFQSVRLHLSGKGSKPKKQHFKQSTAEQLCFQHHEYDMTFVPFKHGSKCTAGQHPGLLFMSLPASFGADNQTLPLFRSWMRQHGGACPSSSTSPSLVQLPAAK